MALVTRRVAKNEIIELAPNEYGFVLVKIERNPTEYLIGPIGTDTSLLEHIGMKVNCHYEFDIREGDNVFIKVEQEAVIFIIEGSEVV